MFDVDVLSLVRLWAEQIVWNTKNGQYVDTGKDSEDEAATLAPPPKDASFQSLPSMPMTPAFSSPTPSSFTAASTASNRNNTRKNYFCVHSLLYDTRPSRSRQKECLRQSVQHQNQFGQQPLATVEYISSSDAIVIRNRDTAMFRSVTGDDGSIIRAAPRPTTRHFYHTSHNGTNDLNF